MVIQTVNFILKFLNVTRDLNQDNKKKQDSAVSKCHRTQVQFLVFVRSKTKVAKRKQKKVMFILIEIYSTSKYSSFMR